MKTKLRFVVMIVVFALNASAHMNADRGWGKGGEPALHYAMAENNLACFEALIKMKADVNIRVK